MSSILRGRILQIARIPVYQVRNGSVGYWNRDWAPNEDLPKTPEEIEAVSKKYNLLPEEYKPYKDLHDLGLSVGDYPKLPDISEETKDKYYPYDLYEEKVNFGEARHMNQFFWTGEKADVNLKEKMRYNQWVMLAALLSTILFFYSLCSIPLKFFPPVAAKHMPNESRKHYSYD